MFPLQVPSRVSAIISSSQEVKAIAIIAIISIVNIFFITVPFLIFKFDILFIFTLQRYDLFWKKTKGNPEISSGISLNVCRGSFFP